MELSKCLIISQVSTVLPRKEIHFASAQISLRVYAIQTQGYFYIHVPGFTSTSDSPRSCSDALVDVEITKRRLTNMLPSSTIYVA